MNSHAMNPLQQSQRKLWIRDFDNLNSPGTWVLNVRNPEESGNAIGVTGINGYISTVLERPYMGEDLKIINRIENILVEHKINPIICFLSCIFKKFKIKNNSFDLFYFIFLQ